MVITLIVFFIIPIIKTNETIAETEELVIVALLLLAFIICMRCTSTALVCIWNANIAANNL